MASTNTAPKTMTSEFPSSRIATGAAMSFIQDLQARLEPNHPEKYQKFLDILNGYFQNPRSIEEVHGEVKVLLEGEVDLIRAFEKFLPAEAVKGGVGKVVESGK